VSPGQGQGPGPGFGTGFATGTGPGFPTGPLPTEPSAPKPHSPAPIAPRQSSTWDVNARASSPVPMERRKDEALPPGRGVLSIPVKSIPGPEDTRVPPVNKPVASASFSSAPAPKRREPFHRSREQEKAAYGRLFLGCGKKDDYELAIKLGEGTFG
jgi:serine/threonine-protein kinase BUR1